MTTTLRPTGPEGRDAEGRRHRAYEIRVNTRPVGALTLLGPRDSGPPFGTIEHLHVEEGDRRRGRATVAALAAEEILRGWGCTHVEAHSAAAAGERAPGDHLSAALGYAERSRHMIKELRERPALPPGSEDRPLRDEEFAAWCEASDATYVGGMIDRGLTRAQAAAGAEASRRARLPEGAATQGVALRVLTCEGADVGTLWLAFTALPRRDVDAWVFDVNVDPARRGAGHGRSLMTVAEHECLQRSAPRLGLNVFTDNTPAVRLYTSLGYRTAERFYVKKLS
ncbi:GNAT family N-acetyltransferase [Streptomyces tubbatahanensis]|uniref:GNAT family N-acetyltransferase n=1 Tax=Streptomyces tubbatahanensis TaxID=2923272 RepID=A0ABY3XNF9_9ACTN|nr:GNAT family N-acetyltransferase [Streptomyces tubbatahanensis]UNS95992.1 GNAT family N-acetyltransferase [Streptomyces tubbatahanensis]